MGFASSCTRRFRRSSSWASILGFLAVAMATATGSVGDIVERLAPARAETLQRYHDTQRKLAGLWPENLEAMEPARLEAMFRHDTPAFASFFFPEHTRSGFNDLHRVIFQRYREGRALPVTQRQGERDVFAAPRGGAKSTIGSLICPIESLAHRREKYIVIFSATQPQATQRVRNIRDEIESNARLNEFYRWDWQARAEQSFEVNGIRVEGHGILTARRGINVGPFRPTWIILDDVEEDDSVENPEIRGKTASRFSQVIAKLGDLRTHMSVLGTLMHPNALLAGLLEQPDFNAFIFQSLEAEPTDQALWEQWKAIFINLDNPRRAKDATAFYEANRPAMDKGAKVFWPENEPLLNLQSIRVADGEYAFQKEKQNRPRNPDTQIFFPEAYEYFDVDGPDVVRDDGQRIPWATMMRFAFLDPAMGMKGTEAKTKRGQKDFSALAVIGIGSEGRIYLLDLWMDKRATPEQQIEAVFDYFAIWGFEVAFEAVGFQEVMKVPFEAERMRRERDGRIGGRMVFAAMGQHANKTARIMRLQPMLNNKWIAIRRGIHPEFMNQMVSFPTGAHEDGLDALEGAVKFAQERRALRFAG